MSFRLGLPNQIDGLKHRPGFFTGSPLPCNSANPSTSLKVLLAISKISREGTIKIGRELWAAKADRNNIEKGEEVTVIGQAGLKLTVIKKSQEGLTNQRTS